MINFENLKGQTLVRIKVTNQESNLGFENDVIFFYTDGGSTYKMYHFQECCEGVSIEDIEGDLDDLIGSPITCAEEVIRDNNDSREQENVYKSTTWTFYKLGTIKGSVVIRWYGESNGWYSESVYFDKVDDKLVKGE